MQYILYFLLFIFGYYTHKTFHSYLTTKVAAIMLLRAKMVSVLILIRCLQQYSYIKHNGSLYLLKQGATKQEIDSFKKTIDNDIEFFKKKSIKNINKEIPEYFKILEHFDNWDEAMDFLKRYQKEIPKEMI